MIKNQVGNNLRLFQVVTLTASIINTVRDMDQFYAKSLILGYGGWEGYESPIIEMIVRKGN